MTALVTNRHRVINSEPLQRCGGGRFHVRLRKAVVVTNLLGREGIDAGPRRLENPEVTECVKLRTL
jgi:hypothetical protein